MKLAVVVVGLLILGAVLSHAPVVVAFIVPPGLLVVGAAALKACGGS